MHALLIIMLAVTGAALLVWLEGLIARRWGRLCAVMACAGFFTGVALGALGAGWRLSAALFVVLAAWRWREAFRYCLVEVDSIEVVDE